MRRTLRALPIVLALLGSCPEVGLAQTPPAQRTPQARPRTRPAAPRQSDRLDLRAFGLVGAEWFTASQSFDAVLGSSRGTTYGGGLGVTEGPGYIDVSAQRFSKEGSRAFVGSGGEVFPLGIPATITVIPLDVTFGWRFRGLARRLIPQVGVGYTRVRYEETSEFADEGENVKESYNGFHIVGGAEVRVSRWIGLAGEVMWTSISDALGKGGVSETFDETDLGGTSFRLKLVIGR